ncbi:MAG: PHP domain-containing protein [Rickettsiales bacterium]|jgi:predicted metal-dependent phosphoesterase TrpH|nr:PHP domain-containing protein [Rickettsiales bacterium]
MVDLHTHSIHSDGRFTPEEVVDKAYNSGVRYLSLTDHDTISGIPEFLEASKKYKDIHPVIGCEVSARLTDVDEIHILALGIKKLEQFDRFVQRSRYVRGFAVVERIKLLQQSGYNIGYDDILNSENYKGTLTNEHVRSFIIREKIITPENFKELKPFKNGGCAHLNVYGLFPTIKECLKAIHDAGAIAIMAHPYKVEVRNSILFELIKKMKDDGLDGLECYHSNHTLEQTETYLEFAEKLDMLVTGGSDHHGKEEQEYKEYGMSNKLEQKIPIELVKNLPIF